MITKKEYIEAKLTIQLYESQNESQKSTKNIPNPPKPPENRLLREGEEPPNPKSY